MKVLFVSSLPLEYNTSSTLRNLALINGLYELGHEIHTLTACPQENYISYDETLDCLKVRKYYIPKGKVYTSFTAKKNDQSRTKLRTKVKSLIRDLYYSVTIYDPLVWLADNLKEVKLQDSNYDLLLSSSDPISSHVIAQKLVENCPGKFRKWLQYWGDPIFINIDRRSKLPGFIIKAIERRLLSKGNHVVYVSPLTANKQKELYPELAGKITFIPPAYLKPLTFTRKQTSPISLRLGYFGDYNSRNRNIIPLYEAARKCGAELIIAGNSDLDIPSVPPNIQVYKRLPYSKIQQEEAAVDILVCVCNKHGTQIPGKVYHYAATNKPVLVLLDGNADELRNYLRTFNRFVLSNNETDNIIKTLTSNSWKDIYGPCPAFQPRVVAETFLRCINNEV